MFLAALFQLMDTFRLVRPASMLPALSYGAVAAVTASASPVAAAGAGSSHNPFSRYVAPLTEETLQGAVRRRPARRRGALGSWLTPPSGLRRRHRLRARRERQLSARSRATRRWRCGSCAASARRAPRRTTALFAIVAKTLSDATRARPLAFVPGLPRRRDSFGLQPPAVPPLAHAAVLLPLPIVVLAVFARSERATREWVGAGLDLDLELLSW